MAWGALAWWLHCAEQVMLAGCWVAVGLRAAGDRGVVRRAVRGGSTCWGPARGWWTERRWGVGRAAVVRFASSFHFTVADRMVRWVRGLHVRVGGRSGGEGDAVGSRVRVALSELAA